MTSLCYNAFMQNIQFVKYGRSGSIIVTKSKKLTKVLKNYGWNLYKTSSHARLNPPTINLVDIVDVEKVNQYQNIYFNYALYKYLKTINHTKGIDYLIKEVISKHKLFFKNFAYHISISPILKYTIKIEGSDDRIHKLKTYLLKNIIEDDLFVEIYDKIRAKQQYNIIKKRTLSPRSIELQNECIKKYNALSYSAKDTVSGIDFKALNLKEYDYILFILNGCFKIMPYFNLDKLEDKLLFWEVHLDNTKGENKYIDLDLIKDKKVLLVDSVYSGKTLLYIKNMIEPVVETVHTLGVFPKSDNVANFCDYSIIFNKIVKKTDTSINIEKIIAEILGVKS